MKEEILTNCYLSPICYHMNLHLQFQSSFFLAVCGNFWAAQFHRSGHWANVTVASALGWEVLRCLGTDLHPQEILMKDPPSPGRKWPFSLLLF